MRTIFYYVWDKTTGEKVYFNPWESKCKDFIAKQENPDNFAITYKWRSL